MAGGKTHATFWPMTPRPNSPKSASALALVPEQELIIAGDSPAPEVAKSRPDRTFLLLLPAASAVRWETMALSIAAELMAPRRSASRFQLETLRPSPREGHSLSLAG